MNAMDPAKYEIAEYFIDPRGKWAPRPILPEPGAHPEIDVVFPVLHGTFGEDGTVQGLLELAGLPYVGAGVMASAVSMDKEIDETCLRGTDVADCRLRDGAPRGCRCRRDRRAAAVPGVVKPANLGSSVGISKAHDLAELEAALALAGEFDEKVIVERGIEGRELECAVLGNREPAASMPCEILPSANSTTTTISTCSTKPKRGSRGPAARPHRRGSPPGDSLLSGGGVRRHGPRGLPARSRHRQALHQRDQHHPGFTSISMYPKMWEQAGIGFAALVDRLIDLALDRHPPQTGHQVHAVRAGAPAVRSELMNRPRLAVHVVHQEVLPRV